MSCLHNYLGFAGEGETLGYNSYFASPQHSVIIMRKGLPRKEVELKTENCLV